jgi:FADH2 O2-dependent halogenase
VKVSSDVAVVGSGFAGSLFAMLARRVGRTVVLVEKGSHPRFAIGESSSPLANLLLEGLCRRYGLDRVAPLASWGSWQRAYPELGCGLKRGFTFYAHRAGRPFAADPGRRDHLLVAASPRDEVADTHWLRADVDHFLVREAEAEGVVYLDHTALESAAPAPGGMRLSGVRDGRSVEIAARLVVDASGPRGFLHRVLGLAESPFPGLPGNEGLFTHFERVARVEETPPFRGAETPPYPPDDAALHHVFDGGWIWVLRFGNGLVSAGAAAAPRLARALRLEEGAPAWARLLCAGSSPPRVPCAPSSTRRSCRSAAPRPPETAGSCSPRPRRSWIRCSRREFRSPFSGSSA